ncbi:hypothetical protein SCAR479_02144 [Seiridium cardinale]|uniref:Uncharacterized protein n=1 Tax=Seiridium cardinale TaxID=138064 RepID=A0ABR2Y4J2_9PEZI
MSDSYIPARPPTPQALLHRQPDKVDSAGTAKPSKYIILIMGSTEVAGKVQIAKTVSGAFSCPQFNGDSMHDSCAKAASVGATRRPVNAAGDDESSFNSSGANEARYQRMWMSKMTRTGLLFPEESRPANEGFSGFGGSSSTSTSRRGSASSIESASSNIAASTTSTSSSMTGFVMNSGPRTTQYHNNPTFTLSEKARLRKDNPVLLVLTHPQLETWHKDAIRTATKDYGIGIIYVPLYEDDDIPVLKPLDPRTMTSFGSFGGPKNVGPSNTDEEIILRIDTQANVETIAEEIVAEARSVMGL